MPGLGKCFVFDNAAKGFFVLKGENSWRNPGYEQNASHPVACINWNDAKAYAAWLSQTTGKRYRLISEAEWEYAARAGSQTTFYFGDDPQLICKYANAADQTFQRAVTKVPASTISCSDGFAYTAPVGSFAPNKFGLYDMYKNVWETVEDCANDSYKGAPADGSAWLTGDCSKRVRRGGSFFVSTEWVTSAFRFGGIATDRVYDVGFRVARDVGLE